MSSSWRLPRGRSALIKAKERGPEITPIHQSDMDHPNEQDEARASSNRLPPPTLQPDDGWSGRLLIHRLMLATPLYFYYHHLTPPGYFSRLLRMMAHLQQKEEAHQQQRYTHWKYSNKALVFNLTVHQSAPKRNHPVAEANSRAAFLSAEQMRKTRQQPIDPFPGKDNNRPVEQ